MFEPRSVDKLVKKGDEFSSVGRDKDVLLDQGIVWLCYERGKKR